MVPTICNQGSFLAVLSQFELLNNSQTLNLCTKLQKNQLAILFTSQLVTHIHTHTHTQTQHTYTQHTRIYIHTKFDLHAMCCQCL